MPTGPEFNDDRFRNMRMSLRGLASDVGLATASAGAATLNDLMGIVTSEALTTAQNAIYTLTITNSMVAAGDLVQVTVGNGTNSAGSPMLGTASVTASTITVAVHNKHATAVAFNGTLKVYFTVIKAL